MTDESHASLSDEEIVRQVQNGHPELISILVERYTGTIYHLAMAVIPREDCADVVQDVLLHVVRSVMDFRESSRFKTWLYGLTKNRLADYHRSRQRHPIPPSVDQSVLDNRATDPWQQAFDRMTVDEVLSCLSEFDRHIVVLRLMEKMSFAEIAEAVGSSYEAVRSRFRRAAIVLANRFPMLSKKDD